jgi:hypothetical protein
VRDYSSRRPLPPSPEGAPPPAEPTRSVRLGALLAIVVAVLAAVGTVLTFVHLDTLAALAVGPSLTQQEAARRSIALNAVVDLAVTAGAWVALAILLWRGRPWARVALTVVAAAALLLGVPGLWRELPWPLQVTRAAQLSATAASALVLWRRDATEYLRPRRRR